MKKNIFYLTFLILTGLITMISCRDDLLYDPGMIGDGNSQISATVSFHPLVSSLDGTRAAGSAIKAINDIQLVVFKYDGTFYDNIKLTKEKNNLEIEESNTNMPSSSNDAAYNPEKPNQSEEKTSKATFNFSLPFGRYYIYVVANCPDMDFDENNAGTIDALKLIQVQWNNKPGEVGTNDQMFGCLATDSQKDYDDTAPLLTINRNSATLHAWIKRLASKVTIVYDGRDLHEGIFVYINKATIRDIPKYCHFGANNSPFSTIENGEVKYAKRTDGIENITDSIISVGESIYYNAEGDVSSTPFDVAPDQVDYLYVSSHWMPVNKSSKDAGKGNDITEDNKKIPKTPHHETGEALYFYENCQGNYPNDPTYDKHQDKNKVGKDFKVTEGQTDKEDYKDEVICGTYIEVEGFYTANYDGYLSSGPIKYRFMLGQDPDYNYNALRNRHYKLTLKFRGYANQPDWHIEYEDHEPGLYPPDEFLMSYLYNVRHEMPIRLTGNPTKVTMQVVENNWAPYDPDETDNVPPSSITIDNGLPFEWNKEVYSGSQYEYGLHSVSSSKSTPYGSTILNKTNGEVAEDWVNREVTPIWVGFLGLQAPTGYENENTLLPTGVYNLRYESGGIDNFYDQSDTREGMKSFYYGVGDRAETMTNGTVVRPANSIPLYENVYNIDKTKLSNVSQTFNSGKNNDRTGRNSYKAELNDDESVTIYVPMFTLPKDLGYITGFSGNNPYECYYRKAVVKITAEYADGDPIVKFVPVFQTRRMVNPKAVWRTWNDTAPFTVTLMSLDDYNDPEFTPLISKGVWEAWVATPENESKPLQGGTFTLSPLGDAKYERGKIIGITGSTISFKINFAGVGKNETECGKIIIHYHNLNCEHSIYVRQGYNVPVQVTDGANDKYWSSYAVFSFDEAADTYTGTFKPERNNSVWTFPQYSISGLKATLTVNPLALGTMYKRGNYAEGIRIINNKTYPVLTAPGDLTLTCKDDDNNIKINTVKTKSWNDIYGIPYLDYLNNDTWPAVINAGIWSKADIDKTTKWEWSAFESTVPDEYSDNTFIYDVPTVEDYVLLTQQGFGVGVTYADGATETANTPEKAFGFFNTGNNEKESDHGMRGFIVYNLKNFNQIFFPLGYSGVGRRTIQNNDGKPGILRYGNQAKVLSVANNANNQYRPIPYNNPNNPGAVYWAKKKASSEAMFAMDMNYFDLTFGPYDYAVNFVDYGDAVPIKPVVIKSVNTNSTPAAKAKQKKHK